MTYDPIVAPVVALVAWSLIMMIWMYAVRFPAMKRAGVRMKGRVGSKGGALDGVVENEVQWKAHNYNHLMEQPTLFYAVALALAIIGSNPVINLWLAWAYVGFRILHSLIQATVNIVTWRFAAFLGGSFCLLGLVLHAGMRIIHDLVAH